MFNFRQKANKGFTLIEMSIVLVIIGLIIGGILKGQEIVANSRAKAVVNQVNAARAAANTYLDRFRALPGDHSLASTRVDARLADGGGNGVVGATSANIAALLADDASAGENYQYFKALLAANLLNGGQVDATTNSAVFGTSALPSAPISGAGMTLIYGSHAGDGAAGNLRAAHWYRIHRNATTPASAFSPRELTTIDNQTDDGLPGAGGVRGSDAGCYLQATANTPYVLSDSVACVGFFEAH